MPPFEMKASGRQFTSYEDWGVGLELRPGSQHSAFEAQYFLDRVLPRVERLVLVGEEVLSVADQGFDSARRLFAYDNERRHYQALGCRFDWIVKWNPRKRKKKDWCPPLILGYWVAHADEVGATWQETRPGKRVASFDLNVVRAWAGEQRSFHLAIRAIELAIDKKGQALLVPEIEAEGWLTSLPDAPEEVIAHYAYHGMHEQFHSEIKTDLDMERLPSGKFDANDTVLHLGMFAYNCLRLIGQLGLTGEISPVKRPAKRRPLRTVLEEVMYHAAQFIAESRKLILDFGALAHHVVPVFVHVQGRLLAARSP